MNKKSQTLLYSFFMLSALFCIEVGYLYITKGTKSESINIKREFIKLTTLPDLAISTEATYIRHRSLSDFFSIYKDDGTLREYFASTFVFNSSYKSGDEK